MFCYQCEQTSKGIGCRDNAVCGKDQPTAALQDLLIYASKGIAELDHQAEQLGAPRDPAVDRFLVQALFSTVTNVNFDAQDVARLIWKAAQIRVLARNRYLGACAQRNLAPASLNGATKWSPAPEFTALVQQGEAVSILSRKQHHGDDVSGLQELLLYGLKGLAAYAEHALDLGQQDATVFAFVAESLEYLARENPDAGELLGLCLRCGEVNLRVMELLDRAHTTTFGDPIPTPVRVTPVAGKAIVVSGHDLQDLYALLQQTEGSGIQVYTHGEMLPAHGYPKLKAFKHLAGNYGGAWQEQGDEFARFPGAIVMTTNCIQEPRPGYADRLFTSGLVAWPGVPHIVNRDFTPVIEAALAAPGFSDDGTEKTVLVGFGHRAVLQVAGQIIDAVKEGAIRHFFLVGGCDGARPGRNYYTEFTQAVPRDCVILTLACGKYRFNQLDFGTIQGLPRLLDLGQCNDAYSAIRIATALAQAFGCGVNELPLSLVLSWYEQKAVAILLTLLHLGIRNIRLGPTLPAFLTPALIKVLNERFNLQPISTPRQDLAAILGPENN